MDDAGLDRRLGEHGPDRVGEALQAIDDGEQNVFDAAIAQRRRGDFARFVRDLIDGQYPDAERLVLVMDQLNTHGIVSLYEAFPPREARRLAQRLEIHHTPKHGSWLNMAEIELSVLRRDLPERIARKDTLVRHVAAWQQRRNAARTRVDWRFTTEDARIKLRKLYPTL